MQEVHWDQVDFLLRAEEGAVSPKDSDWDQTENVFAVNAIKKFFTRGESLVMNKNALIAALQ